MPASGLDFVLEGSEMVYKALSTGLASACWYPKWVFYR